MIALLLAVRAFAADTPTPPTEVPEAPDVSVPELPTITTVTRGEHPVPWRVTMFEDPPGSADCDPEEALRGRCIEEVRFVSPPSASDGASELARWRSVAVQEALLWEGLAYRWGLKDDPLAESLVAAGYDTVPTPADAWEKAALYRGSVSAPDPAAWLLEPQWIGGEGFFPTLRYRVSNGRRTPPVVVIAGRFAERLGAKGRPHDFDLMDATPGDSSPFFEQLYPFANAEQAKMERPLSEFDLPVFTRPVNPAELSEDTRARFSEVVLPAHDYETLHALANRRFAEFTKQLSVQVAQFALEDYTPNHMRVFTALSAMVWPPRAEVEGAGTRRLVAAARGETDSAADIAARVDRSSYVLRAGFRLDLEAISPDVASDWVAVLYDPEKDRADLPALQAAFAQQQGLNIRRDAPRLEDPRRESMALWAQQAAGYGVDPGLVLVDGQRFTLGWLLDRVRAGSKTATREEGVTLAAKYATEILLHQLRLSAASVLDDTPGARAAPGDVVGKVSKQWETQLSRHGFAPRPMAQPYGGIDPTAICTTIDGPAALSEPSYGAVRLDVLVHAPDREPLGVAGVAPGQLSPEDARAVLWDARSQLPFLLVDDPDHAPEGTRLAGLPGGEALYRIRWHLWTGWHLFWVDEELPGRQYRLAVRTGAVCDDTVIAPDDLVATLVRASLLADTYRPTTTVPAKPGQKFDPNLVPPAQELVDYVRERALAPLRRMADSLGGFLLVTAEVDEGGRPFDVVPPTPYARDGRTADGEHRRTAMWARFFGKEDAGEPTLVYPAFRPSASVGSDSLHPRWSRVGVTNMTFTGGLGIFPERRVSLGCGDFEGSEGFVAPCDPDTTWTEGASADLGALTTYWVLDHPRIGLEAGMEARFDVSHSGRSWTHPDSDPSFTWMFRPGGGLLVGARFAPRPAPLWVPGSGHALWGVDRVDGSSRLDRVEGGIRGGYILAPGYNGTEGTFIGEVWGGMSARRNRSPQANLTPYNPGGIYGLYARVMYANTLIPEDTARRYELDSSFTVVAGLRATWDLQLKLPEAPKVE